jgi:Co/Zn/Cd efflux system component
MFIVNIKEACTERLWRGRSERAEWRTLGWNRVVIYLNFAAILTLTIICMLGFAGAFLRLNRIEESLNRVREVEARRLTHGD